MRTNLWRNQGGAHPWVTFTATVSVKSPRESEKSVSPGSTKSRGCTRSEPRDRLALILVVRRAPISQ